jgi:hypothetical protein
MSLQLPISQNTLSEPKPYSRDAIDDDDYESNSFQVQQDRAWLREQLLAGKNSPLCEPITPTFFERLRARARGEFKNAAKSYRATPSCG